VLWAQSSAKDTDWHMSLVDVDEKGKLTPIVGGRIRARFRKSFARPELLQPGKPYEYTLDLWHVGMTIPAGRRVRVEVASAAFPSYSRNLNTGGHNETETNFVKAQQTVLHDRAHPSAIILPVLPATN